MNEVQYIKKLNALEEKIEFLDIDYAVSKSTVELGDIIKTKYNQFFRVSSIGLAFVDELPNLDYYCNYVDESNNISTGYEGCHSLINQNYLHDNYLQKVVNGKLKGVEDIDYD